MVSNLLFLVLAMVLPHEKPPKPLCRCHCDFPHRRDRARSGQPPECAGPVRLLRALALLVAVLLRRKWRARHAAPTAMRVAALFLRGARAMAAISGRLPGILPAAGAAARPQYRFHHA